MSIRQHTLLAVGLALVWILGNTALKFDPPGYGRLFSDDLDRALYAQRGSWALNGTVPYRDVLSDIPAGRHLLDGRAVSRGAHGGD